MKRALKCGGEVRPAPTSGLQKSPRDHNNTGLVDIFKSHSLQRVWVKRQAYPGLAISRSIGDDIAHTVGVTHEPEIKTV